VKQLNVRLILRMAKSRLWISSHLFKHWSVEQGFELLATFRPAPMLKVLNSKGYSNSCRNMGNGTVLGV